MSYDVTLTADLGGPEPVTLGILDWNCTSNYTETWAASGLRLRDFDGKPAGECLPILRSAIQAMEDDPRRFIVDGDWMPLQKLRLLVDGFMQAPRAIVHVW